MLEKSVSKSKYLYLMRIFLKVDFSKVSRLVGSKQCIGFYLNAFNIINCERKFIYLFPLHVVISSTHPLLKFCIHKVRSTAIDRYRVEGKIPNISHLISRLEASVGDLGYSQLFMVRLLGRDDGRVRGQGEVDAGIRHQVGLELRQVYIQGAVEAKGSGDGGHDLKWLCTSYFHDLYSFTLNVNVTEILKVKLFIRLIRFLMQNGAKSCHPIW